MNTVSAIALRFYMSRLLRDSPDTYLMYARLAERLAAYPQWVVTSMAQSFHGGYTVQDGYVFGQLWHAIHMGEILTAAIEVGRGPHPDKCERENNEALSSLPSPFSAKVVGGCAFGGDGNLRWHEDIVVTQHSLVAGVPSSRSVRLSELTSDTPSAVLEVGYQPASRTWLNVLTLGAALARWPYESDWIYLFCPTRDFSSRFALGRSHPTSCSSAPVMRQSAHATQSSYDR